MSPEKWGMRRYRNTRGNNWGKKLLSDRYEEGLRENDDQNTTFLKSKRGGDMCLCMADSLYRTAEANTAVENNHAPIKNHKQNKDKDKPSLKCPKCPPPVDSTMKTWHGVTDWGPAKQSYSPNGTGKEKKIETIPNSLVAQLVKNLPAIQETLVRFLDREDLLEKR